MNADKLFSMSRKGSLLRAHEGIQGEQKFEIT